MAQSQMSSVYYRGGSSNARNLIAQIFFPTNRHALDAGDQWVLDALVSDYLPSSTQNVVWIRLYGHADQRGNDRYNLDLSNKRAGAVMEHLESLLGSRVRFVLINKTAAGEQRVTGDLAYDRRVDIYSSLILTKKAPPTRVTPKTPKKYVRRPIQFIDIETEGILTGPHAVEGHKTHMIIVERWGSFPEERTVPSNPIQMDFMITDSFPHLQTATRYHIGWRRPNKWDRRKQILSTILQILSSVFGTVGGWDFGSGIPALKPPNILFSSWEDVRRRDPEMYKKYTRLRGKRFWERSRL